MIEVPGAALSADALAMAYALKIDGNVMPLTGLVDPKVLIDGGRNTIVYERDLASTRAIDEPEVATFLACWLYEETMHGHALRRFLAAAG